MFSLFWGVGEAVSYLNRHFVLDWRSGFNLGFESIIHITQENGYAMSKQQYGRQGWWRGNRLGLMVVRQDRRFAYQSNTFKYLLALNYKIMMDDSQIKLCYSEAAKHV